MSDYDDTPPPEDDRGPEVAWSLEAEQSVLGGMMLSTAAVDDVMEVIKPKDLWEPKHEQIALAIGALVARNEPTDVLAVVEELRRTGNLRKAGGAAYLHTLTSLVVTPANAGYYADTVKHLARKRRLTDAGMRIEAMGRATEGDIDELLERAQAELATVESGRKSKLRAIGETFMDLIQDLETKPEYQPSPWESLDKLIGGFAPGALYVVAARPGSGKSIVALQAAAKLAHTGVVAFSSLEMTELELQKRLLAQYGPVHMTQLRNHTLNKHDWANVAAAKARVEGAPIFVDDTAGVTMSQIRAHARAVARRGDLAGIVVDYLQLVEGGDGDSRQERVSSVSRGLKQLAKDMSVPVIAAAQLKRSGAQRGGRALPTLDDLRESGAIEQDADVVLLLDRDREKKPDDLTVIVAKNRHGESGKFTLQWQAQFARVMDKQWTPTALYDEREM